MQLQSNSMFSDFGVSVICAPCLHFMSAHICGHVCVHVIKKDEKQQQNANCWWTATSDNLLRNWWGVWYTEYLAPTRRKFLIIINTDVAAMGQRHFMTRYITGSPIRRMNCCLKIFWHGHLLLIANKLCGGSRNFYRWLIVWWLDYLLSSKAFLINVKSEKIFKQLNLIRLTSVCTWINKKK